MTTKTEIRPNGEDTWEQRVAQEAEGFLTEQLINEQDGGVLPRSFLHMGDEIAMPTEELPVGLRVTDLNFKGYRKVWDTKTGEMSLQPRWLLWQTARKRHPDRTRMFTTVDPHIPQDYGEDLYCPLNPEAPKEERFGGMGFKPCRKRHIPHLAAQQSHLEHSHKRAFIAIQQKFAQAQREEDRELQLRAITAQEKVAAAMLESVGNQVSAQRTAVGECDICHEQLSAKSKLGLNSKMRSHMKSTHN